MIVESLKKGVQEAMRARDEVKKDVLRTALGEIQTGEARKGEPLTEDEAQKLIRKLIKSNEETLAVTADAAVKDRLLRENVLLEALLPRLLGVDEIVTALAPVAEQLRAAKAEGPATGIAMKHLKSIGAAVEGTAVGEAIRRLRA
jgi:uncharacterized protein YqeY